MREYKSFMKDIFISFTKFMSVSQKWSHSYDVFLKSFDRYLNEEYSTSSSLSQEMVDKWCAKHGKESNNSNRARTNVVIALIRYMDRDELSKIKDPERPKTQKCTHLPHPITSDELSKFFYNCDHIRIYQNRKEFMVRKLVLCVIFRLMYSTGIRPNEARQLKCKEVDLNHGVLNITETKGHDQHYVALHKSMVEILVVYDSKMELLIPSRQYFFPKGDGSYYNAEWLRRNFKKLWDEANPNHEAVSYDFRHNYAIMNINSWINDGTDSCDKVYYLSKNMGHCNINHTLYYYSIVPQFSDIQKKLSDDSFSKLVPEVEDYEEW
ncbi:MAG: tyrosine-type recombinase/integrase [Anaerovoracaceae bacterium]